MYKDDSYRGSALTVTSDIPDLERVSGPCDGHWGDCISSISVAAGWRATVFEHDNYRGDSRTIDSNVRNLEDLSGPCSPEGFFPTLHWGDCISSIRVSRP